MIEHRLDAQHAILYVYPQSSLEESDFVQLTETVDPYIEQSGGLAGLLINAPCFPGWDSFGALAAHIRFVREHHKQIKRVALVTDSSLGSVAESLAGHFISAEIRHLPADELETAEQWIINQD